MASSRSTNEGALKVHLARASGGPTATTAIAELATRDRVGLHRVVDQAADADVILFVDCHLLPPDPLLAAIRHHPLRRVYPAKTLVYDERDFPTLFMPGITVNMPWHSFSARFQAAWSYYYIEDPGPVRPDPDLLFTFVGSPSHPCRQPVFALRHERAVVEEVRGFVFHDPTSPGFHERKRRFHDLLRRSKFVLCPRGQGTSSIRLYETMAAGRVPVVIADDWTPPAGPRWSDCAVFWPQSRIPELPSILERLEPQFEAMSTAARREYETWFHPDVAFHHLATLAGDLVARGAARDYRPSLACNRALIAPYAHYLRSSARKPLSSAKRRLAPAGRRGVSQL